MKQPVCAHLNVGPHSNQHFVADSVSEAVSQMKSRLWNHYGSLDGILDRTGVDNAPTLHLYYVDSTYSDKCNSEMNFHDYPSAAWQIGPRGGIRKVYV